MQFHLAAYSISPGSTVRNDAEEAAFIEALRALPFVCGIEVPHVDGAFHRWDESFLLRHADPSWTYVATGLPTLMGTLRDNPGFGLAAVDADARGAAVRSAAVMRDSVRRMHDRLGHRAFRAVELHSGVPAGRLDGRASSAAFAGALTEIGGWDWDGAELVVEHCDAAVPGQDYQKGFLSMPEEIAAILDANRRLNRPVGGSLNWGRSAIEGRGAAIVAHHTAQLLDAGLLRGMIFSGASGADTKFGAWQDTHMPQAPERYAGGAAGSLLTEAEMRVFLRQASGTDLAFLGLKIAIRPADASPPARIALLRDGLTVLAAAALSAGGARVSS